MADPFGTLGQDIEEIVQEGLETLDEIVLELTGKHMLDLNIDQARLREEMNQAAAQGLDEQFIHEDGQQEYMKQAQLKLERDSNHG